MEEEAKQHFRGWIWGEVEEEEAKQHFVRNLAVKAFPHGKAISGGNLWRQSLEAISRGNL